jgi:AAA15 family ATPase/GTPase
MLIEFSVSNFRSVKEKITFSMLAEDSSTKKDESSFKTSFNMAPDLSTLSVIYGPNASGKSNLLMALDFVTSFVLNSHKMQDGDHFEDLKQFKLGKEEALSEFEVVFIQENFLFQYGFSLDKEKIYDEWLYATEFRNTKQKSQTWISRSEGKIGIPKEKEATKNLWFKSTRSNALILSTAVQLNSEKLRIPFDWFKKRLRVVLTPESYSLTFLNLTFARNLLEENKNTILKFMQGLDFSFEDLETTEHLFDEGVLENSPFSDELKKKIIEAIKKDGGKTQELKSVYRLGKKSYKLGFEEESKGTRALFAMAGPILDVLENGYVLVVDELDTSLHPLALRGVIELFKNPKTNPKHAQLIFTTHDTSVMDLFNREQVWLVEKNNDYASELISVSDFEGRSTDIIEKKYMAGRYGALPRIGDLI